jgi:hypothetical protein
VYFAAHQPAGAPSVAARHRRAIGDDRRRRGGA